MIPMIPNTPPYAPSRARNAFAVLCAELETDATLAALDA